MRPLRGSANGLVRSSLPEPRLPVAERRKAVAVPRLSVLEGHHPARSLVSPLVHIGLCEAEELLSERRIVATYERMWVWIVRCGPLMIVSRVMV
jgi:hypothetical protein